MLTPSPSRREKWDSGEPKPCGFLRYSAGLSPIGTFPGVYADPSLLPAFANTTFPRCLILWKHEMPGILAELLSSSQVTDLWSTLPLSLGTFHRSLEIGWLSRPWIKKLLPSFLVLAQKKVWSLRWIFPHSSPKGPGSERNCKWLSSWPKSEIFISSSPECLGIDILPEIPNGT